MKQIEKYWVWSTIYQDEIQDCMEVNEVEWILQSTVVYVGIEWMAQFKFNLARLFIDSITRGMAAPPQPPQHGELPKLIPVLTSLDAARMPSP